MTELKITLKKAQELYPTSSREMKVIFEETFGKESLMPKKITDIIQSELDLLLHLGLKKDFLPFPNPKSKEEKAINATMWLFKLAEALNEGTIINWSDTTQYKYFPCSYLPGGSRRLYCHGWSSYVVFPGGLVYKNSVLCEHAMKYFPHIFNDFFMVK